MNKSLKIILISTIILMISIHLFLSFNIHIDYYDSFDYLRNARAIIEKNNNTYAYTAIRPILIPFIEIPFLKLFKSPNTIIKSIHFLYFTISFFTIVLIYKLSHLLTSKAQTYLTISLFAPIGLLSNKLFTHYFFFGMPDISTSFLIILLLYFTNKLKNKKDTNKVGLIFLILILLSLTKFYFLIFSMFYTVFLYYFYKIKTKKLFIFFISILAIFIIAHILPLIYIGCKNPLQRSAKTIYKLSFYKYNNQNESPIEYFITIINSASVIYLVLFAIGFTAIIKNKEKSFLPSLFIFISILLLISLYSHKESRYIMPILPSFYLVCAYGIGNLNQLIKNKIIHYSILTLIAFLSIFNWFSEINKFKSRIYYTNYNAKLAQAVIKLNTQSKIIWFGNFITLSPKNLGKLLIQKNDDFMYKFHISSNTIYALSGLPCVFAYTNVEKDYLFPPEYINLDKIKYCIFADTASNTKLPAFGIYKTYKLKFKQLINKKFITIQKTKEKILISIKKYYSAKIIVFLNDETIKIRLKNGKNTPIPKNIFNKILNKPTKFQTLNLINN